MMIGRGCADGARGGEPRYAGADCVYVARFARFLAAETGHPDVRVLNRAAGGTTTGGALPALPQLVSVERERDERDMSGEIRAVGVVRMRGGRGLVCGGGANARAAGGAGGGGRP